MNKEKFIEQAHLYLMNELDDNQIVELENAMSEDDQLKAEFNSIKQLYEAIADNSPEEIDEHILISARNSMMRAVRAESIKPSLAKKISDWLKNIFVINYKLALGGAGMLAIGFVAGYLLLSINSASKPMIEASRTINVDDYQKSDVKISNIRIPTSITGSGEIEVSFDAIKPISYKGSAEDPFIQRLLASSLVREKNPGLRLRTLNTINAQLETQNFIVDPKIKTALITALKVDGNPAVRKEALNALLKFKYDNDVRDALLFVLSNDRNSGLRVSAINALAQIKIEGNSLDEKIINVLNRKAENDESDFIKIRAASLVKEVN